MYNKSKLTGKVYLENIEIIQDDRLLEWQQMHQWFLNGGVFTEVDATQEEIQQQQIKASLQSETEQYIKRQQDGVQAYAEISAEFRLAKLNGIMTEASQIIIEKILIPVRNEVLAGQWISAKNELEEISNKNIGADLYNRLLFQISNYILLNY